MSAMSEVAAELDAATRCATIRCPNVPTVAMVWHGDEGYPVEAICTDCHEAYLRRPWVVARVTFLPRVEFLP